MDKRPWPLDLDHFSSLIGENIFMVQGPGGNTSFKDDKTMWVKASGTRLVDAVQKEIFTGIDVESGEQLEVSNPLRPSIEKDFHLLVPFPYVIHTHSYRAISMAIEDDFGKKATRFPDIAFVPYARPGADLCNLIKESVDFEIHNAAILQNHGFLTWGLTMEIAYDRLLSFEGASPNTDFLGDLDEVNTSKIEHPKAITPDYAVFLSTYSELEILEFNDQDFWKKQMYLVAKAAAELLEPDVGINYLANDEVKALQNWDSEKYRISVNK
jgi:hypothetical protein